MKPRVDIRHHDPKTQVLIHAILLLFMLLIGAYLSFDVMLEGIPSALLQWIAAIAFAKIGYFIVAYVFLGESFVDPLEKIF